MGVSWEGRRARFEWEVVLCGMVRVRGKRLDIAPCYRSIRVAT
jgi:hypothetical protein